MTPMATLSDRWNRIRTHLTLGDMLTDVGGKMLAAFGLGLVAAAGGCPSSSAGWLIALGILMSLTVKAKHWKRFWGEG